jgi:hypothetical protein
MTFFRVFVTRGITGGMRPLRWQIGHGRRWLWGVDGAAGMREVAVDAGTVWASCSWSSVWLLFLVGRDRRQQSTSGHIGSCKSADGGLADGLAVAVLDSLCSPVCVL